MDKINEAIPGMMEDVVDEPIEETPDAPVEGVPEDDVPETPEAPVAEEPVVEKPEYVVALEKQLADLQEQVKTRAEKQPDAAPQQSDGPKLFSDEWFNENEKHWGFSKDTDPDTGKEITRFNQRTFLKEIVNLSQHIIREARGYTDQTVHGNVADMRFETQMRTLERQYPDIRKHEKNIREYLEKRYKKQDISNPDYIVDGLRWSRGAPGSAPSSKTPLKNVKVNMPAPGNRGGKPVGAGGKALGSVALGMIKSGEFKDEAEYRAWERSNLSKV